jgi:O-methyltransferase
MTPRRMLKRALLQFGFEMRRVDRPATNPISPDVSEIPCRKLYAPLFSPWLSEQFSRHYSIAAPRTLVSVDRCYVIYVLLQQCLSLDGDIVECGVYKGGTAAMIAKVISESGTARKFFLFDTFAGMPETDSSRDLHRKGDFADTSLEEVKTFVNAPSIAVFRAGFIPDTFAGLESHHVSFVHIDVDIYKSIIDSLEFLWPRLLPGGSIVFDDYGFPTCPGARQAVDDFFGHTTTYPLCLPTGQAVVFKHTFE